MNAISINLLDSDFNNAGSSESTFLFSCPKIFQENKFSLKNFLKMKLVTIGRQNHFQREKKLFMNYFHYTRNMVKKIGMGTALYRFQ